jgi:hypothetical protein
MFTGELVDTRSQQQKRRDEKRQLPQQAEMFSPREVLQFGVRANPKLPISPKTRLELAMEDRRTPEEREADRQQAIEEQTYPLFVTNEEQQVDLSEYPPENLKQAYSQYDDIKRQYPQAIVFFRMGSFFEAFNGDAEVAAREANLVLTSRRVGDFRVAMTGIPHEEPDEYIHRLVDKGYQVAICDYVDEAPAEDGVIPRAVVRVISRISE